MNAARNGIARSGRAGVRAAQRRNAGGFAPYRPADPRKELDLFAWDSTEQGWEFAAYSYMLGPVAMYALYYVMYGEDTNLEWAKAEARARIARHARGEEVQPGVYYGQRQRAEELGKIHKEMGIKSESSH